MRRKHYIKNLEYKVFTQFGKKYLSVDYDRNGEHNHYTLIIKKPVNLNNEKDVRKFINS